jgi:hypothetical protein
MKQLSYDGFDALSRTSQEILSVLWDYSLDPDNKYWASREVRAVYAAGKLAEKGLSLGTVEEKEAQAHGCCTPQFIKLVKESLQSRSYVVSI